MSKCIYGVLHFHEVKIFLKIYVGRSKINNFYNKRHEMILVYMLALNQSHPEVNTLLDNCIEHISYG